MQIHFVFHPHSHICLAFEGCVGLKQGNWTVMAATSVVCSWLMAACMSVACEKDSSVSMLSTTSPDSNRLSRWAVRRRRRAIARCATNLTGIRNLMSSCLPCDHFYKSSCGSENLFGFGSKNAPVHRRRRKSNLEAAPSGRFLCFGLIVWLSFAFCCV